MILPRARKSIRTPIRVDKTRPLQRNMTRTVTQSGVRYNNVKNFTLRGVNHHEDANGITFTQGRIRRVVRIRRITTNRRTKSTNLRVLMSRYTFNIKIRKSTHLPNRLVFQSRTSTRRSNIRVGFRLNTQSKTTVFIRLNGNNLFRTNLTLGVRSNVKRVRKSIRILRTLRSITNRTTKVQRSLRTNQCFNAFRHRTTNRSRTSITTTRSRRPPTCRVTLRISVTLNHANNMSTYKTNAQSTGNATNTLPTTRTRSSTSNFRGLVTLFPTSTISLFIQNSIRRRHTRLRPSANKTRRFGTTTYMFQTNRLLTGTIRTRTIISTLIRSTTRLIITLWSGSVTRAVLPYTMDYNGTYETTTSSSRVGRNTLPPT